MRCFRGFPPCSEATHERQVHQSLENEVGTLGGQTSLVTSPTKMTHKVFAFFQQNMRETDVAAAAVSVVIGILSFASSSCVLLKAVADWRSESSKITTRIQIVFQIPLLLVSVSYMSVFFLVSFLSWE